MLFIWSTARLSCWDVSIRAAVAFQASKAATAKIIVGILILKPDWTKLAKGVPQRNLSSRQPSDLLESMQGQRVNVRQRGR